MTAILYEHPLNERMRNYLKLEQLFAQANGCFRCGVDVTHSVYFSALFAVIDTLDRNDIRGDLIKDLEKLEQNLVIWSQAPNIDTSALEENLRLVVSLISSLKCNKPNWLKIKEDKFLAGVKQRFAMQGGNSSFDLPQLQFWLYQPQDSLVKEMKDWLAFFSDIYKALALVMRFTRQKDEFVTIQSDSGFYQDNGEGLSLLRIKIAGSANFYPTISGNKYRYSIRFMLPCEENGRKYSSQATTFQLAKC